ncbi:dethiobiotin synthase [Halorientalis regularis]|jgi:dethiobiotin synthetase|uniref:ATP-dependent dethiobiotin synthetase BioD n=1 Tax=Halorientalis regularis TaxID=660518 RepID=A0A1G7S587_9EURY|nr:dethiobiotin synthase [Halorientalis regularis]SDG18151.1 dethiobiotin synthetase [Halorientalis regularis]
MSDEIQDPTDFAVVGTDTGVGKTVVTAGLVGWLRESGVDARAVKPCQTGYPPDDDAGFVADACGDDAAATCLRRLEPALAPAVAAEQVDAALSYESILSGCRDAIAEAEVGVVEGIGGLRVPLANGREVVDLVADLDVPALVVARSGLGTINHTALTVETLRARGVTVAGIVCNEYAGETTAERTNPDVIAGMTGVSVETVPPLSLDEPGDAVAGVSDALSRSVFPTE